VPGEHRGVVVRAGGVGWIEQGNAVRDVVGVEEPADFVGDGGAEGPAGDGVRAVRRDGPDPLAVGGGEFDDGADAAVVGDPVALLFGGEEPGQGV
jgi:hypothetical protein